MDDYDVPQPGDDDYDEYGGEDYGAAADGGGAGGLLPPGDGGYDDEGYGNGYDDNGGGGGGGDFDDTPFHDGMEAAAAAATGDDDGMTYDYPGSDQSKAVMGMPGSDLPPPSPAPGLGQSTGSQGFANASVSSLPEEIDVSTHGLIDETVQRLSFIHGVVGVLIIDRDGLVVHATMPMEEAALLTGPVLQLLSRARECAKVGGDELTMLTVRTRKHEMLLCSEQGGAFAICVLQDPSPSMDKSALVFEQKEGVAKSVVNGS